MKDIKKFYTGTFLVILVVFCSCLMGQKILEHSSRTSGQGTEVSENDYGRFLAAHHALYVNDFDNAVKMAGAINAENKTVSDVQVMADFFGGKLPKNASSFKDSKELVNGLIYDAYLIQQDDWKSVYSRHDKDVTIFAAPLRIFSGTKLGKTKEVNRFLDSLKINDSWKAFAKGQVAVLKGDTDAAAKEFAKVHPDFMNINDYLYLMSFYQENGMTEDMDILRNDFISKPGGMYILNYPDIPDWSNYAGYKNNLVFSLIQNISHTQMMIHTDLSLVFLRFAQTISNQVNGDAINYYLGQYYFHNSGDYKTCFESINRTSPFYLFGVLNIAEKNGDMAAIKKMAKDNPLFIPAVQIVVREAVKNGDKSGALRVINRALNHRDLPEAGRAFFLGLRANVYLMFNDTKRAQKDVYLIKSTGDKLTLDFMGLQANIWLLENRNLDEAYNYAMTLIKNNTSDIVAWDLVAQIVAKKEGVINAIDILESVSAASGNVSLIYEHLGDLYVAHGDTERALRAYTQALDLSDDGLIVVPFVQKKIRKLK